MKKLSRKERKEIYLKAAELVGCSKDNATCYACYAIELLVYGDLQFFRNITANEFPELFLFKPEVCKNGWFGNTGNRKNQTARIDCLLLCAAMTDNP